MTGEIAKMSNLCEGATDCQIEADKAREHPCHGKLSGCKGWMQRTCEACGKDYCAASPMRPAPYEVNGTHANTCGPCRLNGTLSYWQEFRMNHMKMGPVTGIRRPFRLKWRK